MWKIKHGGTRKTWVIKSAGRSKCRDRPPATPATLPVESASPPRRVPDTGEPLAYCAESREWTPMQWLPKAERDKNAEQWFRCEYCGGRKLTLRHVSMPEAMRRSEVTP